MASAAIMIEGVERVGRRHLDPEMFVITWRLRHRSTVLRLTENRLTASGKHSLLLFLSILFTQGQRNLTSHWVKGDRNFPIGVRGTGKVW